MYYPFFTAYILIGLTISLLVVSWAIRNGQFGDQQRARFLPLEEEPEGPGKTTKTSPREIYALGILAAAGLLTSGAVLIVALLTGGR